MWEKIKAFSVSHVLDWLKELLTRPKMISAFIAGLLVAFGAPAPLSHTIGDAVGAVAGVIEQHQPAAPADNLPPVVTLKPDIVNKGAGK
jgi:hypothetical protein